MKSIIEDQVDWSVLSNTVEIVLPVKVTDYPILLQLFDTSNEMILEATFKQAPILLKDTIPTGTYRYVVIKNKQCLLSNSITL